MTSAQEHAFGQHGGRLDHAHVEIVALELVAIEAADVHPRVVALVVARQEMVAAAVEGEVLLHAPPVRLEKAGETAVVIHVAVGEGDRVDLSRLQPELEEVVEIALPREVEVEGEAARVAAARHLDPVPEAVLGLEGGHAPRLGVAEARGHLLVRAQAVDEVVHHGGDGQPVDRLQAHAR